MTDLHFDKDFQIYLDDTKDFATVHGREEFEQRLAIQTTAFFFEHVGSIDRQETRQRIRLQAERVARQNDQLTEIRRIEVVPNEIVENAVDVTVLYISGEDYSVKLS